MKEQKYYLGVVSKIEDDDLLPNAKEYHEVLVDIPDIAQGVKAYPKAGELDEPKVGDPVLLLSLDPVFNSYMIYEKIKDHNDFIGFRASGKTIDITPERIVIGVYNEDVHDYKENAKWDDDGDRGPGEGSIKDNQITSIIIDNKGSITIDACKENGDEGNVTVYLKGNTDITIDGDSGNTVTIANDSSVDIGGNSEVKISGDAKISVSGNLETKVTGNAKVEVSGNLEAKATGSAKIEGTASCDVNTTGACTVKGTTCKVEGTMVQITGGTLSVNGLAAPTGSGPFCGLPVCLLTGAPHVGNIVSGT